MYSSIIVQNTVHELYSVHHRVGRVLSFSQVVGIGTPPIPHPQARVPPSRFWGEGHTRWRERGWESPNSDEGTCTVVLFIYTYFVVYMYELSKIVISEVRDEFGGRHYIFAGA
jgi:hypothetical protein